MHRVVMEMYRLQDRDSSAVPSAGIVADELDLSAREVVHVADRMSREGLAIPTDSGSLEGANAALTDEGIALARTWQSRRGQVRHRRVACRDAVLDWLYEQNESLPDASAILEDQRSRFFGERFTEEEVNDAVDYLADAGLVSGLSSSAPMLLRPQVSHEGKICVERYNSSVTSWQDRGSGASTSFTFTGNNGLNFASNSQGASQTITMTTDARQQVLRVADALEEALPVLGLSEQDTDSAHQVSQELRNAISDQDKGRLARALDSAKSLAVSGTGKATGAGIALLVNEAARAVGLG